MEEPLKKALRELKTDLPAHVFDALIRDASVLSPGASGKGSKSKKYVVGIQDRSVLAELHGAYAGSVKTRLKSLMGRDVIVEFALAGSSRPEWLNPHFTFDRFVPADCNEMALGGALSVAQEPGRVSPLLLFGDVGTGKTHLVHAIAHRLLKENPGFQIHCLSIRDFQEEMREGGRRSILEFRESHRHFQAIVFEDLQLLHGASDSLQEEFFHLFNHYHETGKQVLMTADRPPVDIAVSSRLMSRFLAGLHVPIQLPTGKLRKDVLLSRMKDLGVSLKPASAEAYTKNLQGNMREVESLASRLFFFTSRKMDINDPPSILVQFEETAGSRPLADVRLENIVEVVCTRYGVTRSELLGISRRSEITLPRHVAMDLAVKYSNLNKSAIARFFGKSDHTSVINAQRKIERKLKREPRFQNTLDALVKDLRKTRT